MSLISQHLKDIQNKINLFTKTGLNIYTRQTLTMNTAH